MSAIVLVDDRNVPPALRLASLATGSKCLPASLLPKASGLILHDSHSEILALRGLNRFLLQEAKDLLLLSPDFTIPYLLYNQDHTTNENDGGAGSHFEQPFKLDPSISIHLFSTEPPCGDASMEFIMSAQQDATPWTPLPNTSHDTPQSLPGRSYFSSLSVVRRKPSRPDAPPTLSKSCTDKLTLKQFTSTLSSLSSLFISPSSNTYISSFTVPHDKYNSEGYTRALTSSGRLSKVDLTIKEGLYSFTPFKITPLLPNFPNIYMPHYPYSKPPPDDTSTKTSNISVLYVNSRNAVIEVLISGVKQGNGQLSNSHDGRKGSVVCRRKMWQLGREIAEILESQRLVSILNSQYYKGVKKVEGHRNNMKNKVVDALGGWEKNAGDDDWTL
ncbi:hypothetical protein AA313_de0206038 [Arthrobotrys entomopaga]|nr:hypothetical protein AA313_de0206038 [Arthrobotrys entomopaga]